MNIHAKILTAIVAAATLPGMAMAQFNMGPPKHPDPFVSTIPSTAASPPALSFDEVQAQPKYKTSAEEFAALKAKAHPPAATLPDWSGLWEDPYVDQFDPGWPGRITSTAPLTPAFRARHQKTIDNLKKGIEWDVLSDCLPEGYPRINATLFFQEYALTAKQIWMLYLPMNETRRIYTDGRGHFPDDAAYPSIDGDSIAFWDGDTLIVHTTNLRASDNGYARNGPPQSDDVTTVERWRKINPKQIVVQTTVYDPTGMTDVWRPGPRVKNSVDTQGGVVRMDTWACENSKVTKDKAGHTLLTIPGEKGSIDQKKIGHAPTN
jgi:hypothetical protein